MNIKIRVFAQGGHASVPNPDNNAVVWAGRVVEALGIPVQRQNGGYSLSKTSGFGFKDNVPGRHPSPPPPSSPFVRGSQSFKIMAQPRS